MSHKQPKHPYRPQPDTPSTRLINLKSNLYIESHEGLRSKPSNLRPAGFIRPATFDWQHQWWFCLTRTETRSSGLTRRFSCRLTLTTSRGRSSDVETTPAVKPAIKGWVSFDITSPPGLSMVVEEKRFGRVRTFHDIRGTINGTVKGESVTEERRHVILPCQIGERVSERSITSVMDCHEVRGQTRTFVRKGPRWLS